MEKRHSVKFDTRQQRRTSLFLMEIIVVVFFFVITTMICIQLYVYAYTTTDISSEMTRVTVWADNLAQLYHSSSGNLDTINEEFSDMTVILNQEDQYNGSILICLDKDFSPISNPMNNLDETIADTAYELVLTGRLEDADSFYSDTSTNKRHGYACSANIFAYNLELSDELITAHEELTPDEAFFVLPVDFYIGEMK